MYPAFRSETGNINLTSGDDFIRQKRFSTSTAMATPSFFLISPLTSPSAALADTAPQTEMSHFLW